LKVDDVRSSNIKPNLKAFSFLTFLHEPLDFCGALTYLFLNYECYFSKFVKHIHAPYNCHNFVFYTNTNLVILNST
jgi:hypothetical protein